MPTRPEIVLEHFDHQTDEQQAAAARQEEQARALRSRHATLADETERWLDLYPKAAAGQTKGITADDVDRKVADLREQLDKLDQQIARLDNWSKRLADREARRTDLQDLLTRLADRLSCASDAERAALIQDFVLKIEVEAERDASGKPTFHYQHRRRPDGTYWYAQRIPHAIVHITYVFPDQEVAANTQAEDEAHAQACAQTSASLSALTLTESHALHHFG